MAFQTISTDSHSSTTHSSYSSAFPPLQSLPLHHSFQRKRQSSQKLPPPLVPPKYPSYLKNTLYAGLALEQYAFLVNRRCEFKTDASSPPTSPPKSALFRSTTLQDLLIEERTNLENIDLRLPCFWNSKDKSRHIEIDKNGLTLSYVGPGKTEAHAASVRTNFPMRPQCGIYYFEIMVLSKGDDGYIGTGFCGGSNKLERLPGWDKNSYGYHGDDGHSFAGSGTGKIYGPCFTTGDVIGCGVNFATRSAFYTKNGSFLGTAFTGIDTSVTLYPCVGLRTVGERITANFGQSPFTFDITQYIKDQKAALWEKVEPTSSVSLDNGYSLCDTLIISYLIHHGYTGTALAMIKNAQYAANKTITHNTPGLQDMEIRQQIRRSIIQGNIAEAVQTLDKHYPGILTRDTTETDLLFELKCQEFVELMREYSHVERQQRSLSRRSNSIDTTITFEDDDHVSSTSSRRSSSFDDDDFSPSEYRPSMQPLLSSSPTLPVPVRASGRRLSWAEVAASSSPTGNHGFHAFSVSPTYQSFDITETDDMMYGRGSRRLSGRGNRYSNSSSSIFSSHSHVSYDLALDEEDEEDDSVEMGPDLAFLMKRIMKYGQELKNEYSKDERSHIQHKLVDVFSLLAYPEPTTCPVAYLLDKSCLDSLATNVNTAILAFQNLPATSCLERLYRQTTTTCKELAYFGNGNAVLLNVEEQCKAPQQSEPQVQRSYF
ncbi:uncharacterized protein BYT42DRAFT_561599 [Radiomyces spectabilis]|uniref:uncharacterized protein n=1 Tax=Radiomyces spectabilis TaxID=64574 RepID=UPI00221E6495|nr:uncharacterized protein BYT42DRAFT_561599 [Radiomyces spectabilis]KAI8388881.1 hypothetical protein BYT42DRAFT_561599 [Radiomyces spectabilis]